MTFGILCACRIPFRSDGCLDVENPLFHIHRESLIEMIETYIEYYNNRRPQRNIGVLTPMEKHKIYLQAA